MTDITAQHVDRGYVFITYGADGVNVVEICANVDAWAVAPRGVFARYERAGAIDARVPLTRIDGRSYSTTMVEVYGDRTRDTVVIRPVAAL